MDVNFQFIQKWQNAEFVFFIGRREMVEWCQFQKITLINTFISINMLHNLKYYTQKGRLIETVLWSAPIAVCKWKKNLIKNTTHRNGVLKIEKAWNYLNVTKQKHNANAETKNCLVVHLQSRRWFGQRGFFIKSSNSCCHDARTRYSNPYSFGGFIIFQICGCIIQE